MAEFLRRHDMLFYPEGGRSYSGELKTLKTGLLQAAMQAEVEGMVILPIAIAYDLVLEDHVLARQGVKKRQRPFTAELAEMMRYAVGYKTRAFVTFGEPIRDLGLRPAGAARRARPRPSHAGRHRPALQGHAHGPRRRRDASVAVTRRDLEARIDDLVGALRAYGANLAVDSGAQAVAQASRPLAARGVIAVEGERFRVREPLAPPLLRAHDRSPPRSRDRTDALMLDALSKAFFHALASSAAIEKLATRYGMARPDSFGRRFIAGETAGEAIQTARALQAKGLALTLDLLGESVTSLDEADTATRAYLDVMREVADSGIERNLSLKLSQLGLEIDRAVCTDNLRRILGPAGKQGFFVRVDMESSPTVQTTLDIFTTLWQQEYRNVGVVLQAALYRSEDDLARMNALGARVRLVKGAYKEPKSVAHQKMADVDAAYARMTERLLSEGIYPAIATHDPALIEHTKAYAAVARHRSGPLRVPDAVRDPARPAGSAGLRRLPRPRLRPVRPAVVPLLHAAAR